VHPIALNLVDERPEVNLASLNDTASDRAPDTESPDAEPDGVPASGE
jgi:hypothetical protein